MSTPVESLLISLGVKTDSASFKRATNAATGLFNATTAIAAAAAAGTVALERFVRAEANTADEAAKAAKRIGISVQALTELRFAAGRAGVDTGALGVGLRTMARNLDDFRRGAGEAKDAFGDLGIGARDLIGLSPDEAFQKLGNAVAAIEDPLKRVAIAQTIFGRAGSTLIPLFQEGAETGWKLREMAVALGATLSDEQGLAAERYSDTMSDIGMVFGGLRRQIAFELMPTFQELADGFIDWFLTNRGIIRQGIERWVGRLSSAIKILTGPLGKVAALFALIGTARVAGGILSAAQNMPILGAALKPIVAYAAPLAILATALAAIGVAWDEIQTTADGGDSLLARLGEMAGNRDRVVTFAKEVEGAVSAMGDAFAAAGEQIGAMLGALGKMLSKETALRAFVETTEFGIQAARGLQGLGLLAPSNRVVQGTNGATTVPLSSILPGAIMDAMSAGVSSQFGTRGASGTSDWQSAIADAARHRHANFDPMVRTVEVGGITVNLAEAMTPAEAARWTQEQIVKGIDRAMRGHVREALNP